MEKWLMLEMNRKLKNLIFEQFFLWTSFSLKNYQEKKKVFFLKELNKPYGGG